MELILEIAISVFLVIGGIFGLVGSFGLLKLNDAMSRLHAPTKATTVGMGGVLVASMLHAFLAEHHGSIHEIMIIIFLFITAPITANFIAKVHIHRHETPKTLPHAGSDDVWATHYTDKDPEG